MQNVPKVSFSILLNFSNKIVLTLKQVNDWENHQKDCYTLKSQRRERKYIFKAFSDVLSASYQHKQFSQIKSTCKVIQAKMLQQNLKFLTSNNPICWKVKEEYLRISGRHLALKERTYLSLLSKYTRT